jgi:hypothetical protein
MRRPRQRFARRTAIAVSEIGEEGERAAFGPPFLLDPESTGLYFFSREPLYSMLAFALFDALSVPLTAEPVIANVSVACAVASDF